MNPIIPKTLDNQYHGPKITQWIFLVITVLTIIRSLLHMFLPDSGASIATIPLVSFTKNGADSVILMMSLWGSSQLLMAFVYVLVLWRYKVLIPMMYLLLFFEYSLRMYLMYVKPIQITGTAPGHVLDYVMVPLSLLLFLYSLFPRHS